MVFSGGRSIPQLGMMVKPMVGGWKKLQVQKKRHKRWKSAKASRARIEGRGKRT